jgi:arginine/lysine/histidine transporter system substrate-binding protein
MKIKIAILITSIIALILILFFKTTQDTYTKKISNKTLIVGTSADFAPFSFLINNKIVGFDIDIANEIAQRLNMPIEIVNRSFDMLIPEIQLGNIHMIAAGMSITPEKSEQVLFTDPYITGTNLIAISKKNHLINSFEDLKNKEVVVNSGYTSDLYLSQFKDINIKRLPTVSDAFLAINSGQGDVFVTAENTVIPFFKKYNQADFNIFKLKEKSEDTALAVSKHSQSLYKKINETLQNMIKDGTIKKLKEKWEL